MVLEAAATRLEEALRSGSTAIDLRLFLPRAGAPHRRAVLHELIKTELEAGYRNRRGCPLEDYLRRKELDLEFEAVAARVPDEDSRPRRPRP